MVDSKLKNRVIEIAFMQRLGHLGSCLSSLDIIDNIYSIKRPNDIFILSSGHAAVALYVVLEKYHGIDALSLFKNHGSHPHYNEEDMIYCSTGSLGMGITVAVGRAVCNKTRDVYVLLSDGECAEGSVWEALRYIEEKNIKNLHVYVNLNGYSAYSSVDKEYLTRRLTAFLPRIRIVETNTNQLDCLKGLNAHYHVISENDYLNSIEL